MKKEEYTTSFRMVMYFEGEMVGKDEFSGSEARKTTYADDRVEEEYLRYSFDDKGNYKVTYYPDKDMTPGTEVDSFTISADGNTIAGGFEMDEDESIRYTSAVDPETGKELLTLVFVDAEGEDYAELKVTLDPTGAGKGIFKANRSRSYSRPMLPPMLPPILPKYRSKSKLAIILATSSSP